MLVSGRVTHPTNYGRISPKPTNARRQLAVSIRQGCGLPGLRRHWGPRVIQQFFFISTAQNAERVDEGSFMSGIECLHKMFLYLEGV